MDEQQQRHNVRGSARNRPTAAFGVVAGMVAGVLLAALVIPSHASRTVVAGAAAGASGDQVTAALGADGAASGAGGPGGSTQTAAAVAGSPSATVGKTAASTPAGATASRATAGGRATATGASGAPASTSTTPGITADKIRIGVIVIDGTTFSAFGDRYDEGDNQGYFTAMLAAWHREHLVPVNGRDIEFVYQKFNPFDPTSQRAACVSLVQDQKVAFVIGGGYFGTGEACIAREFKVPFVEFGSGSPATDDLFQQSYPNLFTVGLSWSRILRNHPYWAADQGIYTGKKLGLLLPGTQDDSNTTLGQQITRYFMPGMDKLGFTKQIAATATADGTPTAEALAAQKFQAAGVQVVIIMEADGTNFMHTAQASGYKPQYVLSGVVGGDDIVPTSYDQTQYDGALVPAFWRYGERGSGVPRDATQLKCKADYKAYSGKDVGADNYMPTSEVELYRTCDVARLAIYGLQHAGADLTRASFTQALETAQNLPMASVHTGSFSPSKHDGTDDYRTVRYDGKSGCECWKIVADWHAPWMS